MTKTSNKNKVTQMKKKIAQLPPLLPGSLRKQWNVCSTAGCKCKDKNNPKRHGPYFQLSFSIGGKSSTMFIKNDDVAEVRKRIRRYKKFKQLCQQLVQASVDHVREYGFEEME
jgi:hypothetical protein